RLKEFAEIEQRLVRMMVGDLLKELHRFAVEFTIKKAGPEFQGLGKVRAIGAVSRQIAGGRTRKYRRLSGLSRMIGHQWPVPVDLMLADAHSRELEAIAEESARANGAKSSFDLVPTRLGTVKEQVEFMVPNLRIAGHRLAIQLHVVRGSAKQDVDELVFATSEIELILVSMHSGPTMRAPVAVA